MITTSYGRPAIIDGRSTGILYGSGYGKNKTVTAHADKAAVLLSETFGFDLEKRGNSDGLSAGAHYDGRYGFSLGAWKLKNGHIKFDAGFEARVRDAETILTTVPNRGGYHLEKSSRDYSKKLGQKVLKVSCYSPMFKTQAEAFEWLKTYGIQFCPTLQHKAKAA